MHFADNTGFMVQHIATSLSRRSDQVLHERLGIGFSQFRILFSLEQAIAVRQKQIAESLGQTEASISRQVKLLERGGLLQSTINPHNRREHLIALTDQGAEVTQKATIILNSLYVSIFARLSPEQQQTLHRTLLSLDKAI